MNSPEIRRYNDTVNTGLHAKAKRMNHPRECTTTRTVLTLGYRSADPCWPVSTSRCQSLRHCSIFARSFLSAITFSIHDSSAFSSSGTKNEDSSESTVSKFAEADVM